MRKKILSVILRDLQAKRVNKMKILGYTAAFIASSAFLIFVYCAGMKMIHMIDSLKI